MCSREQVETSPLRTGMRLINFKLGDVSERASKDDFIIAEDYESGTSETLPGERGGSLHLDRYLDTAHYGLDASTEEEDSWQVGSASPLGFVVKSWGC